ncbi:MAG: T9SS type A sorting domain-containing protein [Candidatus Cloacimonetes bacterium]|nr:T9SS type A sorting domain-containing protein [Candidatus Cloacimonadota bacterium]
MKKTLLLSFIMLFAITQIAFTDQSASYGWEDGLGTALGFYGNAVLENSTEQAYEGTHSLKYTEDPIGGTPQAYIWWVTGLTDGDIIDASFWVYDYNEENLYPKGRIWAHYTSDPDDIYSYAGSASGNTNYSVMGWSQLSYSWTFDSSGGTRDGFVVEARIYSAEGENVIYIDSTAITVSSDTAIIYDCSPPVTASIVISIAISITALDVLYDLDLTSVDAADYTLTGTEIITFSDATIDGTNSQLVHLTGSSLNMVGDLILDNIYDSANDTDYDFYAGITPVALTNTNNPDGHIVDGEFATFQGIVSANDEFRDVWISDAYGPYNGVLIYDYDFDAFVAVGDEILFVAKRDEYINLTELKDPILLSIISSGNEPYPPALISGSDIESTIPANTNPAEQWEGQLVAINSVLVASTVSKDDMYIGSDDDWVTTFVIGDNVDYLYENIGPVLDNAIASGEPIDIKGVVDWNYSNEYYRINPRTIDDLLDVEDYPNPANSFVLYQNYPNPVTSSTTISFSATDLHRLSQIEIYNVNGQLIKQFPITNHQSSVEWEGTDESGKPVSNGIYLYKLIAANKSITKKMILLR